MRYLGTVDRQLEKKIREFECLQDKRKAQPASPDDQSSVDGGYASTEDTAVSTSGELRAEEGLHAIAKPADWENVKTNPPPSTIARIVTEGCGLGP